MKELSIEEKARRYDEVKNKLSRFIAQGVDPLITRADVQDFFPELKESEEDEKIRKALLEYFSHYGSTHYQSVQVADILTWLEKQDEQKPADKIEPKFCVGDIMRTLQEATNGVIDGLPVVISIDNGYYRCNNEVIAIKDQDNYEYPPMNRRRKPAWSEEEEKKQNYLIALLQNSTMNNPAFRSVNEGLEEWLKSLKERVQPKQEWSEEDKKMKKQLVDFMLSGIDISKAPHGCVAWIKSLIPQKQWKPSEEQMIVLQEAIGIVGQLTPRGECLKELVEQLKKLREE